ncbi:uncharacterized protein LOC110050668 [Orbicella faveolata]|uniref:uncharacterized protein LOC110050668 n=1 Tax=Orbicella faveolata TaxID=48498 RepID=UPI0009E1C99D|nr:uncharacterized protein LOC110050668 [Orbicella faveolata]
MSTSGTRTSSEIRGFEVSISSERDKNGGTQDRDIPDDLNEKKSRSRLLRFRKRTSKLAEVNEKLSKDKDENKNQEPAVSSASDSQQKTSTEDMFTDVFENIQMQLEIIGGLREKPWTMQRKLQILR